MLSPTAWLQKVWQSHMESYLKCEEQGEIFCCLEVDESWCRDCSTAISLLSRKCWGSVEKWEWINSNKCMLPFDCSWSLILGQYWWKMAWVSSWKHSVNANWIYLCEVAHKVLQVASSSGVNDLFLECPEAWSDFVCCAVIHSLCHAWGGVPVPH